MKLTFKTLQQLTFTVEMDPENTVKELKEKIEKEQGKDFPYAAQKLIYSGKILADEQKLSEYEFDEKKYIVLMITRPPPAPKPAPAPAESKPKPATTTSDDKPKTTTAATTTTSSSTSSSSSTVTPAPTSNTTSSEPRPPPQVADSGRSSAALNELSALSMGEPQVAARLASLMSQPHFRQIQDLIQQSPHLLSSTIESLVASDPELYQFISENPDMFVNALNHPPLAGSRRSQQAPASMTAPSGQGTRSGSQQSGPTTGGRQQPVVDQILGDVTEHDKEAIERLKELGFSEYLAIQAYMACDKDEQLAANLLFQMDQ